MRVPGIVRVDHQRNVVAYGFANGAHPFCVFFQCDARPSHFHFYRLKSLTYIGCHFLAEFWYSLALFVISARSIGPQLVLYAAE